MFLVRAVAAWAYQFTPIPLIGVMLGGDRPSSLRSWVGFYWREHARGRREC